MQLRFPQWKEIVFEIMFCMSLTVFKILFENDFPMVIMRLE